MAYNLAIEFKGCDSKETCLLNKKGKCTIYLDRCKQKILKNPLCFAKTTRECSQQNIIVKTHKKKKYIFYDCDRCDKKFKGDVKKYLSKLNREDIYFGKDFDELAKEVFPDSKKELKKPMNNDEILDYFERVLNSIRSG